VPAIHAAGDDKPWTWIDGKGNTRTQAELDNILQSHTNWVTKNFMTLSVDRPGAWLQDELRRANLHAAKLSHRDLSGADLNGAYLVEADLSGATLWLADLRNAKLAFANLRNADVNKADLTGASLWFNDLSGARLKGTDLSTTTFEEVNLTGAYYEPVRHPPCGSIATAKGLDRLTWDKDSTAIYTLRKSLLDTGFRDAARQVTAAIHRHNQSPLELVLFDWTCAWGANWLRPLELIVLLSFFCTFVYWIGMHFGEKSGLYLAATGQRVTTSKGREHCLRIYIRSRRSTLTIQPDQLKLDFMPTQQPVSDPRLRRPVLARELTALGTAFLFSLMSVLNLGFREFNFGRWIRMLQPRDFDIRARGWMRTISGLQSLLGFGLLALMLLSYFGHPFD
jgi:hypothetical protein